MVVPAVVSTIGRGERLGISSLVLYEYLRGPRSAAEIAYQEALWPPDHALPFGAIESTIASRLYRVVPRARQRELDIAIAAVAIGHDARLWTANTQDFRDIPGLQLYEAPA
jgi:predicted nucleic acid-binding protein